MKAILQEPNSLLLEISEPVKEIDASIRELGSELVSVFERPNCAGISAIQIGVKLRVIGVKYGLEFRVIVNPEIVKHSDRTYEHYEGCLSIDYGQTVYSIRRYKRVKVKGLSLDGRVVIYKGCDTFSAVLQHEIGHLDGILICNGRR